LSKPPRPIRDGRGHAHSATRQMVALPASPGRGRLACPAQGHTQAAQALLDASDEELPQTVAHVFPQITHPGLIAVCSVWCVMPCRYGTELAKYRDASSPEAPPVRPSQQNSSPTVTPGRSALASCWLCGRESGHRADDPRPREARSNRRRPEQPQCPTSRSTGPRTCRTSAHSLCARIGDDHG